MYEQTLQVTWESSRTNGEKQTNQCVYSGSGKTPLLFAASAFVILGIAMAVEHGYMLVAVSKTPDSALVAWDPDSPSSKSLTWQAAFFFISTWVCFAVGEILLLIGITVESSHLRKWASPSSNCLMIREGLFASAGVIGMSTVFLATGLHLTALRIQRACENQEKLRRQMMEAAMLYASPPRNSGVAVMPMESRREHHHQPPLSDYSSDLNKASSFV
uniref:Transmembrane protein n=1 Tax=Kalanchoe fedtschenkoi TaxID=63787 RepID=A0A7N0ZSJ9_KALFE